MTFIGLDAGSTTLKLVVVDGNSGATLHSSYRRHLADIKGSVEALLDEADEVLQRDTHFAVNITGSAGLGLAERSGLPFIQEVLAASQAMKQTGYHTFTLLDLGGEDAKMVFFREGQSPDIRMNGSCAGGTGAFIDQMATLMHLEPADLSRAAEQATQLYPIASRCGVFAKTDIQNLLSRRLPVSDIAASIFRAVAMQTITTLAHGADIAHPVLCTGGPLTFLPALREAFRSVIGLDKDELILLPDAATCTARGAALAADTNNSLSLPELRERLARPALANGTPALPPLFNDQAHLDHWRANLNIKRLDVAPLAPGLLNVYIGIDSGSTTTKFVAIDAQGRLLHRKYSNNDGNPLQRAAEALQEFLAACKAAGATPKFQGSCVTGYGEELVRAALNLDHGIVETMAHYRAAHFVNPNVSFILDIGGQDIKSIFIRNNAVANIELNESCSSGCGSFLQSFAALLGLSLHDFTEAACLATKPCDLGTRCTVFMNSKVKEALRQNTNAGDIAAGLAISVVKNCLFKVLKMQNLNTLGDTIVAQGGTFKNLAVLRALEQLSGKAVWTTDAPELMGAYGAALYAREQQRLTPQISNFDPYASLEALADIRSTSVQCKGCTNNCSVARFQFPNGNISYAGNKCERVFHSKRLAASKGRNQIEEKYQAIFAGSETLTEVLRTTQEADRDKIVGIPRVLNMYENYPFWQTLFRTAGLRPALSDTSTVALFRKGIFSVMSDNICFPAKVANGHIMNLIAAGAPRIFYPLIVKERQEHAKDANSFNCPVVSGYPDVIRSAVDPSGRHGVAYDTPVISFVSPEAVEEGCVEYLGSLGVKKGLAKKAVKAALQAREATREALIRSEKEMIDRACEEGRMLFVLTGRPYHIDPLINQRVAQIVTDLGIDIVSDDAFRLDQQEQLEMNYISQWSYPNRVIHAAHGVAKLPHNVQLIQINSFGCGPDSFLMDECGKILAAAGKNLTIIRLDEISSPGSIRLRLRSLVESLRQCGADDAPRNIEAYHAMHTRFTEKEKQERIILVPWFSDTISPLVPAFFGRLGFNVINLPKPDAESIQTGLQYGHNEVCYPATLVVGDIVKFLLKHRDEKDKYVAAITQTGGQCRATNYLALIKNALTTAGFADVPLVSINTSSSYGNDQPAFKADVGPTLSLAVKLLHFLEALAAMNRTMVVRQKVRGTSEAITERYLDLCSQLVVQRQDKQLFGLLAQAVKEYNDIETTGLEPRRIGLVGEIYIKYNYFGQLHITEWLQQQGLEVVVPSLFSFALQDFVNDKVNDQAHIKGRTWQAKLLTKVLKTYLHKRYKKWEAIKAQFKYYRPESSIFTMAQDASQVINLVNQFGEGWLIAGEVIELSRQGIDKVVCLQPFGCIANHIVARGIENRLRQVCPGTGLLFLDIDSSVARVNLENRLHFLIDQLKAAE